MYSGTDAVVDVILSIGFLLSIWGVWIALSGKSMVKGQQLTATQARTQAAFLIAPTAVNFYVTFAGLRGVLGPVVAVLVVVCFVAQIVYTNRAAGDVTLDLFDDLTPAAQQPDPQPATSPISRPDSSPSAPSAAQVPAPAWCPDPTGRHSLRYWDGAIWTHHVATDGRQSVDPLDAGPVPDGRGPAVAGQPEGPVGGIVEQDAGHRTMLPSSLRPLLDEAQSAYGVWTSLDRDDFFSKDLVPAAESAMQQVLERFVAGATTAGMAPDDVFTALRRRFPGAVGHDFFERTVSSEAELRPRRRMNPLVLGLSVLAIVLGLLLAHSLLTLSIDNHIRELGGRSEEGVRDQAIAALAAIGKPAVGKLIASLEDEDPAVRSGAACVLGKIGDQRALLPLMTAAGYKDLDVLPGDEDMDVRYEATVALANLGNASAPGLLVDLLWEADDSHAEDIEATLVEMGAPAVDPLINALGDPRTSKQATRVLARMGAPAVNGLIDRLRRFSSRDAAAALIEIGDPTAIEPLIATLSEFDEERAQLYLNSGNSTLESAAVAWVKRHSVYGYEIVPSASVTLTATWAGSR